MTPKDMNSTVRAHLRKGELAVEQLERLGWTFDINVLNGPQVWKAPPEDQLVKAVVDLIESRLVKHADPFEEPVSAITDGDHFIIHTVSPMSTALRRELALNPVRVFKAREVEYSYQHGCAIVRFGFGEDNAGFWIPVANLTKVKTYDNL